MKLKTAVGIAIILFFLIVGFYWLSGRVFYNPASVNKQKAGIAAYKAAKEGLFDPPSPPILKITIH